MPYEMKGEGDNYNVYKQGESTPKNKKPMNKDRAEKYMAALYANTEGGKKGLSDLEYAVIEEKCYSESYAPYVDKLSQEQANYDPLGGMKDGTRACVTCRWFNIGADSCYVVHGPIAATGLSDMYMPTPPPYKPEPMPVVIVEADAGAESLAEKPMALSVAQATAQTKQIAEQIKQTVQSFPLTSGTKAAQDFEVGSGFKIMDNGRWYGWWTNNAPDKLGEAFSWQAIDSFIARVDSKTVPYPELWFKHLPIRIGEVDTLARLGALAFASGTFDDTDTGQAGRKWFEDRRAAGKPLTMSHQYLYPKSLKRDNVYHAFNTFELSPLDAGEEANPITFFGVTGAKSMIVKIDAKKRAELLKAFGGNNDKVNALLNFADAQTKALEEAGVDLKSLEAHLPDLTDFEVQDKAARAAVDQLGEATLQGIKSIADQIKGLTADLKQSQDSASTEIANAMKAVTDLKAYVETQFGYTPRASKSGKTAVSAKSPQVEHLKQQSAAAGKKTEGELVEGIENASTGAKNIFDEIIAAGKNGRH